MPDNDLLPIKVLLPQADFQVKDEGGGSARKVFDEVTDQVRQAMADQVERLEASLTEEFGSDPQVPAVAKVTLKPEALAKSHRPSRILSDDTCPIIGVGTFRELFVRATPHGLSSLREKIRTDQTREGIANISTLVELTAVTVEDRLAVTTSDQIAPIMRRVDIDGLIKVQLFDHRDGQINSAVLANFQAWLASLGAQLRRSMQYTPSMTVHEVSVRGDQLTELVRHRGIRAATVMPRYTALRQRSIPVTGVEVPILSPPNTKQEYPTVGVIDSGVSPACLPISPWVMATEQYVATGEENHDHGTFVAGIIAFGAQTNPLPGFDPGGPCLILDVAALPNGDPTRGTTGVLSETELVTILQELIPRYRDRVRVWNLSLGSQDLCDVTSFSDLAKALDAIQRENDVQFVIAAGNIDQPPFRSWPPNNGYGDLDRICSPADSACAFTIGSIAHVQNLGSVVSVNEPSPFSRKGPGAAYLVKPEIVSYGGNCDSSGNYLATGIRSLDPSAALSEDIGTSFATPFVTALLANVAGAIETPPSLNLLKCLVVHSATTDCLGWASSSPDDIKYVGFGRPAGLDGVLFATQSAATLIFEDELEPGFHKELDHFPYPACLIKAGKFTGSIRMTLAYDPPLDPNYGLEYCRANVDASLGTMRLDEETGELSYHGEVPPEHHLRGPAYEEDLVKFGFKWCPIKSYRRSMPRGVKAHHWKLRVALLHRHDQAPLRQKFALAITIQGTPGQPVYDDTIQALRAFQTQDLQLRATVRQRIQASLS